MQPLEKFDLVAVPGKGGAMENWGLLLFDEGRFLFNNASPLQYLSNPSKLGFPAYRIRKACIHPDFLREQAMKTQHDVDFLSTAG